LQQAFLITICRLVSYVALDLEHLRLVVLLWSFSRTLTTWTSWASVIATWSSVTARTTVATWTTVIVTAWATLRTWTTLWLYIALRLLEKSLA
jgi:hypothetical protein